MSSDPSLIGSEFRKPVSCSLELIVYRVIGLEEKHEDGDDLYWVQSGNQDPQLEFASEIRRYQNLHKEQKFLW